MAFAPGGITTDHSHHYLGFAETRWKLFDKERPRRVKPLLYAYRVLLTGIHLMRTGEVEANLNRSHRHRTHRLTHASTDCRQSSLLLFKWIRRKAGHFIALHAFFRPVSCP
jgi:predicted nucleotidyltransferase